MQILAVHVCAQLCMYVQHTLYHSPLPILISTLWFSHMIFSKFNQSKIITNPFHSLINGLFHKTWAGIRGQEFLPEFGDAGPTKPFERRMKFTSPTHCKSTSLTVLVTFPCTRPSTKSWDLKSLTKFSRESRERPSIKARYLSIIDQREYSRIKSLTSLHKEHLKTNVARNVS